MLITVSLAGFEVQGGGFDWFGSAPAHEALTAYGALQFQDMAKVCQLCCCMLRCEIRLKLTILFIMTLCIRLHPLVTALVARCHAFVPGVFAFVCNVSGVPC